MGGASDWTRSVDNLDMNVQCQLTDAVSNLMFSPAPLQGSPYGMVGYRMLAAATWDGNLLIFRVDHNDNNMANPTPAQAQQ